LIPPEKRLNLSNNQPELKTSSFRNQLRLREFFIAGEKIHNGNANMMQASANTYIFRIRLPHRPPQKETAGGPIHPIRICQTAVNGI